MLTRRLLPVLLFLVSCSAIAMDGMMVPEFQMVSCNADQVSVAVNYNASGREMALSKQIQQPSDEIIGMLDRYKGTKYEHLPVKDFLPPDDLIRFQALSDQMLRLKLMMLSESRLQRDASMVNDLIRLARDVRDNKLDPKIMDSIQRGTKNPKAMLDNDEAKKIIYLFVLRQIFTDRAHPEETDKSTCALGLSIQNDFDAEQPAFQARMNVMPAMQTINGIRLRYHLVGNDFAAANLSKVDQDRLKKAQSELSPVIQHEQDYFQDLSNIRFLVDIMHIKYLANEGYLEDNQKADIKAMDENDKALYDRATPFLKKVLDLWVKIDNEFPSMQSKMIQQVGNSMKNIR